MSVHDNGYSGHQLHAAAVRRPLRLVGATWVDYDHRRDKKRMVVAEAAPNAATGTKGAEVLAEALEMGIDPGRVISYTPGIAPGGGQVLTLKSEMRATELASQGVDWRTIEGSSDTFRLRVRAITAELAAKALQDQLATSPDEQLNTLYAERESMLAELARFHELEQERDQLRAQLTEAAKGVPAIETLERLRANNRTIGREKGQLEDRLIEVQRDLKSQEARNRSLQGTLEELQERMAKSPQDIALRDAQIADLRDTLNTVELERDALAQQRDEMLRTIDEFTRQQARQAADAYEASFAAPPAANFDVKEVSPPVVASRAEADVETSVAMAKEIIRQRTIIEELALGRVASQMMRRGNAPILNSEF
jgi:chromosome segregation ATPase